VSQRDKTSLQQFSDAPTQLLLSDIDKSLQNIHSSFGSYRTAGMNLNENELAISELPYRVDRKKTAHKVRVETRQVFDKQVRETRNDADDSEQTPRDDQADRACIVRAGVGGMGTSGNGSVTLSRHGVQNDTTNAAATNSQCGCGGEQDVDAQSAGGSSSGGSTSSETSTPRALCTSPPGLHNMGTSILQDDTELGICVRYRKHEGSS
jgi:hypothetical protein